MTARNTTWAPIDLPDAVRAVAARGGHAVAALDDGRLVRSDDAGATWGAFGPVPLPLPSTALLRLSDAVLVGTPGGVVRAADVEAWVLGAPLPAGVVVTALAGRGATTIAGTRRAGVFRTSDGGLAWEAAGRGLPLDAERLRLFSASSGSGGLVVAHALGISRSTDGGRSWSSAGLGLPLQIADASLAADGRALFAGVGGRLYRTAPAAAPGPFLIWAEVYDGVASGRPLDLLGGAGGALYGAADDPPALLVSTDGGASWAAVGDALPAIPVGLALTPRWLLALGAEGGLWRTRRPTPRPAEAAGEPTLTVEARTAADEVVARFTLAAPGPVRLLVHDVLDAEVACLADDAFDAGPHEVRLPGGALAAGLYRLRLRAGAHARALPFALLG